MVLYETDDDRNFEAAIQASTKAKSDGYQAGSMRRGVSSNPYAEFLAGHAAWLRGYYEALDDERPEFVNPFKS